MQAAPYPIEDLILAAPLDIHRDSVQPQWLDWNGHMNLGYYVVAFDRATTALCRQLGVAKEYTRDKLGMYFVLECHVNYLREITEGGAFGIATQILDHDRKRLHIFHTMYSLPEKHVIATTEIMVMNIDYESRRAAPWPAWAMERIEALAALHTKLERPKNAGSIIGIRRS